MGKVATFFKVSLGVTLLPTAAFIGYRKREISEIQRSKREVCGQHLRLLGCPRPALAPPPNFPGFLRCFACFIPSDPRGWWVGASTTCSAIQCTVAIDGILHDLSSRPSTVSTR